MSVGRLPKGIMFGNLEGVVWRGRVGKEKEWTERTERHSSVWHGEGSESDGGKG